MARGILTYLGGILFVLLGVAGAMNLLSPQIGPICEGGPNACGPLPPSPVHLPILTFIQSLPVLSSTLLVLSLLACGIGYLFLFRNRATVIGVILAYAPFITLVVVGFLSLHLFY